MHNSLGSLKKFYKELEELTELNKYKSHIFLGISLLIFFANVSSVAGFLYTLRAPKSIVYSNSNDAGRAIQTATLTRWFNSNHFGPYGNLYFRFAHSIAKLSPESVDSSFTAEELTEMDHHFALLLTTLISLALFCFFLSYLVLEDLSLSLLSGNLLLYLALSNATWVYFLFTAHPDHLLVLTIALSSYFTLKYTLTRSQKDFVLSGICWGIATAVKRSTVLFIFSFVYLFLSGGFICGYRLPCRARRGRNIPSG